jgi:hypothetical protein
MNGSPFPFIGILNEACRAFQSSRIDMLPSGCDPVVGKQRKGTKHCLHHRAPYGRTSTIGQPLLKKKLRTPAVDLLLNGPRPNLL